MLVLPRIPLSLYFIPHFVHTSSTLASAAASPGAFAYSHYFDHVPTVELRLGPPPFIRLLDCSTNHDLLQPAHGGENRMLAFTWHSELLSC